MCFGCSKEPSHRDVSFEYPQHMFWLRNKKNNFQLHTLIWGPECRYMDNTGIHEFLSRCILHSEFLTYLHSSQSNTDFSMNLFALIDMKPKNHMLLTHLNLNFLQTFLF